MSETPWTEVHGATGPVNTGTGDQHNNTHHNTHNYLYFHDVSPPGTPPLRPLASDHLQWLEERFVAPFGMAAAAEVLVNTGTLLLDGTPGSGRNATARVLLHHIGGPRVPRRIVVDPQDDGGLGEAYVGEGDRLLLDLAEAGSEPARWAAAHEQLPALHQAVRERAAHLVVIVPHGTMSLSNELAAHRRVVTRPDGWAVLTRSLRCDGFPVADVMEELTERLQEWVAHDRPLQEIAHLARLLDESRRSAPQRSLAAWCDTALAGLHDLGARVADQFAGLREGRARALLFTTSMLPAARPEALHAATEELLKRVGHPEDDRPLLEQEDFGHRLKTIGASHRDDGSVAFDTADYTTAVRSHFWTHLPGMWPVFRGWVDRSLRLTCLTPEERDTLVACSAEQCLTTGQYEPLLALAEQWAGGGQPRLVQAAVQVLGHGLSDERAGRRFRKGVLDWASDSGITLGLAKALVAVSSQVIASTHPDQAVVRLHHLARHTRHGEHGARDQLLALALAETRLHRLLLVRLAQGLPLRLSPADVSLFRACAGPRLLLTVTPDGRSLLERRGLRAPVTNGWSALFGHHSEEEWLPLAEEWLAETGRAAAHQDTLLDLLVRAAGSDPAVLARLYALSLRHHCALRLRRKIDAAQGLKTSSSL
ncbi:hypothetical protein [Streptomyces sp. NPDC013489]|uniref:hypothetical protein n=1 Tax=Streptomyces sp. NPDC013489 TaxID=3155606 RepID=UPI0033CB5B94